jgi:miniconductance mechanosensitive channel
VVIYLSGAVFGPAQGWVERLALIYMLAVVLRSGAALLDGALEIYQRSAASRDRPIRGYVQVAKLLLYLFGGILIVATLLQRNPWGLIAGLGAVSAVLLLVFRDTILSLVASVQLTTNDMIRRGDWIEMPRYGADGDVIEVGLHTVKVQNWDKTITTIPTYALIQDSFKNWRGMSESGGRRIKRSVHIDLNTIRFCDDEMLERFARFESIAEYIEEKRRAIAETNQGRPGDPSQPVNRRQLTNVGTFRAYVEAYLRGLPDTHEGMTFLVRQLPPTEKGLPIEIYFFSRDQVWANYEALQADIFDHILAVLPEFDLAAYQAATGHDMIRAAETVSGR